MHAILGGVIQAVDMATLEAVRVVGVLSDAAAKLAQDDYTDRSHSYKIFVKHFAEFVDLLAKKIESTVEEERSRQELLQDEQTKEKKVILWNSLE